MIGQTISHYEILEKLGEGGMGIVYKAQDLKLDRLVALKFLPPHLSASEQDKARFIQEAKAAAALNHPNVCSIIDIQEHDRPADAAAGRQMFIVMEFVEGQTLREKGVNIPLKQAVDIGIQLADGLAAAHEKGIVHRDVKPENIMIRKDGRVQIMDFGLAKLKGASRLTKEGSTVGTAGYMSPEQVQGQETDHRSDIFSLGVVLYQLFTGQLPFKGVHETAIAYEIVNVDAPPMASIKPEIDPALDAMILECLEKDIQERAQSAKQVSIDLKRFKRETSRSRLSRTMTTRQFEKPAAEQTVERHSPHRSYRKLVWPVITAALAVAVALLLWSPWSKEVLPRPVMRFSVDLPPNALLAFGTSTLALSPDGKYLVYAGGSGNSTQLFLRRMDQLTIQPIAGTDGATYPAFSPDGQWVAYDVNGTLMKVSVFGGAPEKICNVQGLSRGLAWTTDNTILFGHISRAIFRVSANGGQPEAITRLDSSAGEISHRFPQLLQDGKTIIFTVKQNNIASFDEAIIVGQRLDTGERTVLVRGGTYGRYVPSGHLIYARGEKILAVPFDVATLEVNGPPVQVEEGGWLNRGSGDAYMAFSSTGAFAFAPLGPFSFENVFLSWIDRRGNMKQLLDRARAYYGATISPDGQKIVTTIQAANDDIWICHIVRGTLTRFTFGGGNHAFPIWSPDGKYIAYIAEKGASSDIFRKTWDGSGAEERLTSGLSASALTSFTLDGKVAFVQNGDIWILPLDGERKPIPFLYTAANEGGAQFSPDGHWMAYSSNESGKDEIYVVPYPKHDGKWQVSTGGGIFPLWTRDGKALCYLNGSSIMVVQITGTSTFDFSVPQKLLDLPPSTFVADIAPNGQQFIVGVVRSRQVTQSKLTVVLEWFDELKRETAGNKN